MYRITGIIHKAGGAPVSWVYYSTRRFSQAQCENMLSQHKIAGTCRAFRVILTNFCCKKIDDGNRTIDNITMT
jgi:antisense regulator of RalR protein